MGLNVFDAVSFVLVFITESLLLGDILYKFIYQDYKIFTKDSPLLFPFMLSIILGACVILLFVRLYKQRKEAKLSEEAENTMTEVLGSSDDKITKMLIIFLVLVIVYSIILPILHFNIATILFVFVGMLILNETEDSIQSKIFKSLVIAVIASPLIYYIFNNVFEVVFP